jgi:hypothetical protein
MPKNYNEIEKSILMLQKEQLVILSKEISNLYLITNYNIKFHENREHKAHFKKLIKSLQNRLKNLSKRIEQNHIVLEKTLRGNIDNIEEKNFNYLVPKHRLEVLLFIVLNRKRLKKYLETLKSISDRLQQMINNSFYQNSFRPVVSKRYSNANIIPLFEKYFEKRISEFSSKDETIKNITFTWEFSDEYSVDNGDDYINFSMSYWNFDIPIISSTVFTHELGHILLDKMLENKSFSKFEKEMSQVLQIFIEKNSDHENSHIDNWDSDDIIEEFLADIIALFYHGTSYLLSLFHQGFAEEIIFIDDKNIEDYLDGYFPNAWTYNFDRDKTFLRLAWLITVCEILNKQTKNGSKIFIKDFKHEEDIFLQIQKSLNLIYPIFKIEDEIYNFYKMYEHYKNINEIYIHNNSMISDIFNNIKKIIISNIVDVYNDFDKSYIVSPKQPYEDLKDKKKDFPFFTNDLWFSWFDANKEIKIAQKAFYRKKIHRETIFKLMNKPLYKEEKNSFDLLIKRLKSFVMNKPLCKEEEKNDAILSPENLKPFKMSLIKGNYEAQIKNSDRKIIKNALGFYDKFFLEKLDETFRPQFKHIRENQYAIRSNHSLLQIIDPIKGKYIRKNLSISCILQIDVKKYSENHDNKTNDINDYIYDNLYNSIIEIYNIVKRGNNFYKFKMFKTLGPSDIIVFLQNTTIDNVYRIKKELKNTANNTLTTILYENELDIHNLKHLCRFQTDLIGKVSDKWLQHIKRYADVEYTTGNYDYNIIWDINKLSQINSLLNKCNTIIEHNTYIKWRINGHNYLNRKFFKKLRKKF